MNAHPPPPAKGGRSDTAPEGNGYRLDMVTDLVPLVFSSGWASGVNAYITVFVLRLFARFSDTSVVPDAFGRTDVLVAAGVMVLIELVVDKVPWLDSAWDGISTVVRPVVGGVVAYQLAGDAGMSTRHC